MLNLMKKFIAHFISVVFHPSILQLLGYLIIWFFLGDLKRFTPKGIQYLATSILLFTWGIPLLTFMILKLVGQIKSFTLENQQERFIPYMVSALCYFACWRLFVNSHIQGVIAPYTLAAAVVIVFCGVTNFFTKISAHAAGCGGITAFVLFCFMYGGLAEIRWILVAILCITGMVFSARKYLNAHTDQQLLIGYFGGMFVSAITLYLSFVFSL
jgi:hypothetical protein